MTETVVTLQQVLDTLPLRIRRELCAHQRRRVWKGLGWQCLECDGTWRGDPPND